MVDYVYTVYVYRVVAMPVISINQSINNYLSAFHYLLFVLYFIPLIHGIYGNIEVHFHKFPCALLLLPLVSYFIVLINVNLVCATN